MRNCHERGNYAYRDAQQQAEIRKERVRRPEDQWSPEQIAGRCRAQGIPMVGQPMRIYEFIREAKAREKARVQNA